MAEYASIPPDDLVRKLTLSRADDDAGLPHTGLVGDTYTTTVSGKDTNGRFCVIDMHVPPGGGPGPHRHDFEETFIILEGEVEAIFRGEKSTVRAGSTINIPANAPHQFTIHLRSRSACCVSVRRQETTSSSRRWECGSRRAPRLRQSSTTMRWLNS